MTASKAFSSILAFSTIPQILAAALNICGLASQHFGNDAAWYIDRIPFFESSDTAFSDVYYYRWKIFRSHQRDLGPLGYITTEFIDDVSWQTFPAGSLVDATGFHLLEGRWSRDRRFKEDYATFMYGGGARIRGFTESVASAVWQGYLVDGVRGDALKYLQPAQSVYNDWNTDTYDYSKGLYWVEPIRDATEYTIASIDASCGVDGFGGGYAFRPSINSYQYSNARAIANLAALEGNSQSIADDYNSRANILRDLVQSSLWSSDFEHFIDRHHSTTDCVSYWQPIRGRELVGYVPWTHDLPDDNATYAQSWRHLFDASKFLGEHGLRTNEPSYEHYMQQYRYQGTKPECQWNGPVWPYQTTQVLTALANFLDHYPASKATNIISAAEYTYLMRQYTYLHFNLNRGFTLNLEEDYYPDSGTPIVGLERSSHYFHSGYIDLIMTGFVGIRPRADDFLEVNPLATGMSYFRAERILYHGNDVAVQWDSTGEKYGVQGLRIEVNGQEVASSPVLTRLTVPVPRQSPPEFAKPKAVSIQLQDLNYYPQGPAYPVGSVSVAGADSAKVQDSIDGRTWFFSETDYNIAHGWETPVGDGREYWYQIDFGAVTEVGSAEIAFFADGGQGVDVPASYRVEVNLNGSWQAVTGANYDAALANGLTYASWSSTNVNLIRLVFTPKQGQKVRLIQWKVFNGLVRGTPFSQTCPGS